MITAGNDAIITYYVQCRSSFRTHVLYAVARNAVRLNTLTDDPPTIVIRCIIICTVSADRIL